jgi:hypothetical protein
MPVISLIFVWNIDKTRIGSPKKTAPPNAIVAASTEAGIVTVPEEKDHAQLRLITAISDFGDFTFPVFMLKTMFSTQRLSRLSSYSKDTIAPCPLQKKLSSLTCFLLIVPKCFHPKSGSPPQTGQIRGQNYTD